MLTEPTSKANGTMFSPPSSNVMKKFMPWVLRVSQRIYGWAHARIASKPWMIRCAALKKSSRNEIDFCVVRLDFRRCARIGLRDDVHARCGPDLVPALRGLPSPE